MLGVSILLAQNLWIATILLPQNLAMTEKATASKKVDSSDTPILLAQNLWIATPLLEQCLAMTEKTSTRF